MHPVVIEEGSCFACVGFVLHLELQRLPFFASRTVAACCLAKQSQANLLDSTAHFSTGTELVWDIEHFEYPWPIDENLASLLDKFFPGGWSTGQRKLAVHIDGAPAHNSGLTRKFFEHNPLKRLHHPPCFPNISLSDFHLFGKVKGVLMKLEIRDKTNLLEAVTGIVNDISNAIQLFYTNLNKNSL
jgi:hypothetical protein